MKTTLLMLAALAALSLPLAAQIAPGSIGITVKNDGPGSTILWLPPTPEYVLGLDDEGNWTVKEGGGAGAGSFLGLSDTPADYAGHEWESVRVNAAGDGVEFFKPALGSGTELQYRNGGFMAAVTDSSVSSGRITLGGAQNLGTTPTAQLTIRNTTAAASGAQQVSPSFVWEGRGWRTSNTTSQTVRFRANVLPVQGSSNPTATWRLQSEIADSGTWTEMLAVTSAGNVTASGTISATNLSGTNTGDTPPAGSGSELQFRSSGSSFGAVTGSSFSGGTLTVPNMTVASNEHVTLTNSGALRISGVGDVNHSAFTGIGNWYGNIAIFYTGNNMIANLGALPNAQVGLQLIKPNLIIADTWLSSPSANVLQMGYLHATTPSPQILRAHDVTTGTGASMTIKGGDGSAGKGHVILDGGNRSPYIATPTAAEIRDILISHGLMSPP